VIESSTGWGVSYRSMHCIALLVVLGSLAGCPTSPPQVRPTIPKPVQMPTYQQVAESYNRNVLPIERLWAKATVTIEFLDDKGKKKKETGEDSTLMIQLPDKLGLMIGKLGSIFVHAGCDEHRYWLFELISEHQAYFGRHALMNAQRMALPIRVSPTQLPMLMGLIPMPDVDDPAKQPKVFWHDGSFVVHPPKMNARFYLHPRTYQPLRIEVIDRKGNPKIIAIQLKPQRMQMHGVAESARPFVPTHIDLSVPGDDWRLTMKLRHLTDANGPDDSRKDRAFRKAFDFEYLLKVHQVKPQNVDDLDGLSKPTARR